MRITAVRVPVTDFDDAEAVYGRALGLPTARIAGAVEVDVGTTRLTLTAGAAGHEHLAFTVPTGAFAAARKRIESRVHVLDLDGRTEFRGPDGWNSRSLYFDGPSEQVLELIERRDLPAPHSGAPAAPGPVCVSEVGIAVPDVLAAVEELGRVLGVQPFGAPSPQFAAVGDQHGLLILAPVGRPWLPTADRDARPTPAVVHLADVPRPARLRVGSALVTAT